MIKIDEAERIVRSHATEWARLHGVSIGQEEMPSWLDFRDWLLSNNSNALSFKCVGGSKARAEKWFEDELGQSWRN